MLRIGRNLRDLDCPIKDELAFSYNSKFDIVQLWYKQGKIDAVYEKDVLKLLNTTPMKTIIHAAFDINDFNNYEDDLIDKLLKLNHKELILHPMIKTAEVNKKTAEILEEKVLKLLNRLNDYNITVYVENNHKDMKCFYTLTQWKNFFKKAPPNTELLIDVVHVLYGDNYEYLKKLVSIKRPKALHIADTIKGRIGNKHLHLPIGKGIINFDKIFNEIIPNYNDLIILEIKNTDQNILKSRDILKDIIKK